MGVGALDLPATGDLVESLLQFTSAIPELPKRSMHVDLVRAGSRVADGAALYRVEGRFMLHLSTSAFPEAAEETAIAIRAMKSRLGDAAGATVLDVTCTGRLGTRSWILSPLCRPLRAGRVSRRFEKPFVTASIGAWLRQIAEGSEAATPAARAAFVQCIEALTQFPGIDPETANLGRSALRSLADNRFQPKFCPMHGDLWSGNVMRTGGSYVVIDWAGSQTRGYPIFDLVRFARSLKLSRRTLRRELEAHGRALGCEAGDTFVPLMAALGHFARNLGEFPAARFVTMARDCRLTWESAFR